MGMVGTDAPMVDHNGFICEDPHNPYQSMTGPPGTPGPTGPVSDEGLGNCKLFYEDGTPVSTTDGETFTVSKNEGLTVQCKGSK